MFLQLRLRSHIILLHTIHILISGTVIRSLRFPHHTLLLPFFLHFCRSDRLHMLLYAFVLRLFLAHSFFRHVLRIPPIHSWILASLHTFWFSFLALSFFKHVLRIPPIHSWILASLHKFFIVFLAHSFLFLFVKTTHKFNNNNSYYFQIKAKIMGAEAAK